MHVHTHKHVYSLRLTRTRTHTPPVGVGNTAAYMHTHMKWWHDSKPQASVVAKMSTHHHAPTHTHIHAYIHIYAYHMNPQPLSCKDEHLPAESQTHLTLNTNFQNL